MSFCSDVKNEILNQKIKDEVFNSFLSGILKSSSEFIIKNNKIGIEIKTEYVSLFNLLNKYVKKIYGEELKLQMHDENNFSLIRYSISFPMNKCEEILINTNFYDSEKNLSMGIDNSVFSNKHNRKAFIKGVFLGCATSNIVLGKTSSSGYHLEFVFSSEILALDFLELLSMENIFAKKVSRKGLFVVYIKSVNTITDLLALLGANNSVLNLMQEITIRSVKNNVNRQNNCVSANINKTVNASIIQVEAIETIENTIGILSLPLSLQEVCILRLANREESLSDLVKLSNGKISRSGLNHRLNKIVEIAKNLKN